MLSIISVPPIRGVSAEEKLEIRDAALPFACLLHVLFSLILGILYSGRATDTVGAYTQLHKHCLLQEPKSREGRMHTSPVSSFRISIPVSWVSVYCGWNQVKRPEWKRQDFPVGKPISYSPTAGKSSPPPQCDRTSSPLCRWHASVLGYRKPRYGLLEKLN